jgi:hypothetical protein
MPNGGCRMHRGGSTGPRTLGEIPWPAAAHTMCGPYAEVGPDAERPAQICHAGITTHRSRLNVAAFRYLPKLPPTLATHLPAEQAPQQNAPINVTRIASAPATATPAAPPEKSRISSREPETALHPPASNAGNA